MRGVTWSHVTVILAGWYLVQSYSRYPDHTGVNLLAMGIVTLGVAMVGFACYAIGYERGSR
jgi:hypothetical protein